MEDYNRSKSYGGSGTMQMESYYGPSSRAPPPKSYSVSYAETQMNSYNYNNNRDMKKGKSTSASKSSSWALTDPELQRKKRVASYKMYSVEGKMKGTFRKSFSWLKQVFWLKYKEALYWYDCTAYPNFQSSCSNFLLCDPPGISEHKGNAMHYGEVDPELEVKIKEGEKLIAQMVQDQLRPTYTFNDKTWDASSLYSWLRYLNAQKDCLTYLVKKERKKMDLLLLLLDKLRCADNAYRKKPIKECLSVQEMNKHNIRCQMVHGSKNIRKEKKLLKDMQLNPQEDKFVSFWTQLEKELKRVSQVERFYHVKPTWSLHHQMPALFITGDEFKYRKEEISELEWRIQRCGVELVNKGDEGIATHKANAKSTANGKTWTSLVSKKELQEQLKVAGTRIEELRKTQLTLGLGKVISQVEREREAMYRDLSSFRKRFPKLCQLDYSRVLKPKGQHECSYMRLDDLSFFYY